MALEPILFIVDDDGFMRELLARICGDAGIPVRTFPSAEALLTGADLHAPCVLLLDVRMPDMSGPDLQALLRERGLCLPIIFFTGFSDVPVAVRAMRNGALDFLIKPLDSATLIARVREAFARYSSDSAPAVLDYTHRLGTLTPREREVLDLMVTGVSSKRIARALGCSFRTIHIHRGRVMSKMAAGSLVALVRMNLEALGRLSTADA